MAYCLPEQNHYYQVRPPESATAARRELAHLDEYSQSGYRVPTKPLNYPLSKRTACATMDKRVTRTGSSNLNSESIYSMYGATRGSISIMNALSVLFGVLAVAVLAAFSFQATAPYVIGENLVSAEVNLGLLQIKPITLFMYSVLPLLRIRIELADLKTETGADWRPGLRIALRRGMVLCYAQRLRSSLSNSAMVCRAFRAGASES